MESVTSNKESFGPQLFSEKELSHAWDLEELGRYCKAQNEAIVCGEKLLAPAYWRLGQALSLTRKHVGWGDWAGYLSALGIQKTRAARARAIFNAFSSIEDLEGLTVEQAYDRRSAKVKRVKSSASTTTPSQRKACLDHVRDELECLIEQVECMSPDEAGNLLEPTSVLIGRVQQFERRLKQQAGSHYEKGLKPNLLSVKAAGA